MGASLRFWCQEKKRKSYKSSLFNPSDGQWSRVVRKCLKSILCQVFLTLGKWKRQKLTHTLRVAELKCPIFSDLVSFQRPVLMSWMDKKTARCKKAERNYFKNLCQLVESAVDSRNMQAVILPWLTGIHTIWNFTWRRKISPCRFCNEFKLVDFATLTNRKILGLKVTSVWAMLHS